MRSRFMKNNSGFSLVELIVVVLIMGIMSGGAVIAFSTIVSARVSSAADMTTNLLKQARQKALSIANSESADNTSDVYVEFYKKDKNLFGAVKQRTAGEPEELVNEKLCNDNVDIAFWNHRVPASTKYKIGTASEGNYTIRVYFKKKTGGIASVMYIDADGDEEQTFADTILIDKPDSVDDEDKRTIILVEGTGRSYQQK